MTAQELRTLAERKLEALVRALPARLRNEAIRLPVTLEDRPSAELIEEGIEPDTLGLFVGNTWEETDAAASPLPPQVILYLENLWELAEGDESIFLEEVRTTYLHELGHYLGLDEDDLNSRGLE